jgi:hypothetical protein
MRKQGILLEDKTDASQMRRQIDTGVRIKDTPTVDANRPGGRSDQAGDSQERQTLP